VLAFNTCSSGLDCDTLPEVDFPLSVFILSKLFEMLVFVDVVFW
jgi:hypothetical protein